MYEVTAPNVYKLQNNEILGKSKLLYKESMGICGKRWLYNKHINLPSKPTHTEHLKSTSKLVKIISQ